MRLARKNDAFSLVEILFVAAIVGILAALVFPSLQKMREGAAGVQCVSNLRQVYAAYAEDTNEHDMRVPRSYNDQSRGDDSYSSTWIEYYHSKLGGDWRDPQGGARPAAIAGCPLQRKLNKLGPNIRTFSINTALTDNDLIGNSGPAPRLHSFAQPGKTALLADGAIKANGTAYGSFNNTSQPPNRLHAGKFDILFLDGHTESWSLAQWNAVTTIPSGGGTPATLFWKGR